VGRVGLWVPFLLLLLDLLVLQLHRVNLRHRVHHRHLELLVVLVVQVVLGVQSLRLGSQEFCR